MKTNVYLKVAIICILININHMVLSQEKFVEYHDFEIAYHNNPDLNVLSKRFDLLYILLLDTTNKLPFFEYDLELKNLYKGYSSGLNLNESTVGFVTQINKIEEIFNSDRLINKVFNCIFDAEDIQTIKRKINYPVYIKNNTAIVEVLTDNGFDIYYFRLHDGVVQINWLGGVME